MTEFLAILVVAILSAIIWQRYTKQFLLGSLASAATTLLAFEIVFIARAVPSSVPSSEDVSRLLVVQFATIPLVFGFGFVLAVFLGVPSRLLRIRREMSRQHSCAQCGYDLRGHIAARRFACPECGVPADPESVCKVLTVDWEKLLLNVVLSSILIAGTALACLLGYIFWHL